jgi:hypothetical protein
MQLSHAVGATNTKDATNKISLEVQDTKKRNRLSKQQNRKSNSKSNKKKGSLFTHAPPSDNTPSYVSRYPDLIYHSFRNLHSHLMPPKSLVRPEVGYLRKPYSNVTGPADVVTSHMRRDHKEGNAMEAHALHGLVGLRNITYHKPITVQHLLGPADTSGSLYRYNVPGSFCC